VGVFVCCTRGTTDYGLFLQCGSKICKHDKHVPRAMFYESGKKIRGPCLTRVEQPSCGSVPATLKYAGEVHVFLL